MAGKVRNLAAAVLALIPFAVVAVGIYKYGNRGPFWDEWQLAPAVQHLFEGRPSFLDVWGQHNEHRILFPKLLMLAVARLTRWNVAWNLPFNVLFAIGWFGATMGLYRLTRGWSLQPASVWTLPAFSFVVFSWVQMENWVWGWQLLVFMNSACVALGVLLLAQQRWSWLRYAAALGVGIVASYTMASGLLYWAALFPLTFCVPFAEKKTRILGAQIWIVMALLTFQTYIFEYHKPSVSPSLSVLWDSPLAFSQFVLLYLGGPLTGLMGPTAWHGLTFAVTPLHYIPGVLGMVLLAATLGRLALWRTIPFQHLLPWGCMMAYAAGAAMMTAVGRVGNGVEYAMLSQYTTTGALFWCGLLGMLFLVWPLGRGLGRRGTAALYGAGAVALIAGEWLIVAHNAEWANICRWQRMGWEAVRCGYEAPLYLKDLSYDSQLLKDEHLPLLRQLSLCGIGGEGAPAFSPQDYTNEAKRFLAKRMTEPAQTYLDTALFFDPANREALELRARCGKPAP